MARDRALERAVGVIVWHLHNGHSDEEAIARAEAREPELSRADIRLAWQWAQAAIRAAQRLNDPECKDRLCDVLDECGVPWRECQ